MHLDLQASLLPGNRISVGLADIKIILIICGIILGLNQLQSVKTVKWISRLSTTCWWRSRRISPYVHRTPVLTSSLPEPPAAPKLFFKCENLQKVGAFKARSACNAVFGLVDADAARGVATHSSRQLRCGAEFRRAAARYPGYRGHAAQRASDQESRGGRLRR